MGVSKALCAGVAVLVLVGQGRILQLLSLINTNEGWNFQQEQEHYYGLALIGAFNHKADPQRKAYKAQASFGYIEQWYTSLHLASPDISGVVIENMFDDSFRANYTTHQVSFVTMEFPSHPSFANKDGAVRGINDQLYFAFEWYLNETYDNIHNKDPPKDRKDLEYVLITDSHDVQLFKNPFEYMQTVDRILGGPQLYVGSEWEPQADNIDWMVKFVWDPCLKQRFPYASTIYNSGILGGHVTVVREFLRAMNELLERLDPSLNCNMAVFEKIIKDRWNDTVVTGYPLHTKFKNNEGAGSGAYIRHK